MIGIIIIALTLLICLSFLIIKHILWLKQRPSEYVQGVGIRYNTNALKPWQGLQELLTAIKEEITKVYGQKFTEEFMKTLIVEIVPYDGKRICPSTTVSAETSIDGSIDQEQNFFWSKKYGVAVVLQRKKYNHAGKSAIAHEMIRHLLPIAQGEGANADEKRQDLKMLSTKVEALFKDIV